MSARFASAANSSAKQERGRRAWITPGGDESGPLAKVLIVDDHEANRELLSRRLLQAGFEVAKAADGYDAIAVLHADRFDLVLLDIMMPGMSGMDVLRHIRESWNSSRLPVVLVSAMTGSREIAEALNTGANDFIAKPVDFPVALARIRSIISRKRAEDVLREREERYALAFWGARQALWDWDRISNQMVFTARWAEMLGMEPSEIKLHPDSWISRIHPDDRAAVLRALDSNPEMHERTERRLEHRLRHRNGRYIWVSCRAITIHSADGTPTRSVGSISDITASKSVDSLTGLPNRLAFVERLAQEIEAARRSRGRELAVLVLDVDRVKLVNDSIGKEFGDRLMQFTAGLLQENLASGEPQACESSLARLSDGEFVILLAGHNSPSVASDFAARLIAKLPVPMRWRDREIIPSISVGIRSLDSADCGAGELLQDAGLAMYHAKLAGGGRVCEFDDSLRAGAHERLELECELARAVFTRDLDVHYQPIVDLRTGETLGVEALLRWNHPVRGLISPARFIPLAEETGLIHRLGAWVLEESIGQIVRLNMRYGRDRCPLSISVNVSPVQLSHPDFLPELRNILNRSGAPADWVKLEVTEGLLMRDEHWTGTRLADLKALGISLQVDDFGTGFSSYERLSRYPFDAVKLDRSFVSRLPADGAIAKLVEGVCRLANSIGINVVAEGVETPQQADFLRQLGCPLGQGFAFSRPLPKEGIEKYLEAERGRNPEAGEL